LKDAAVLSGHMRCFGRNKILDVPKITAAELIKNGMPELRKNQQFTVNTRNPQSI
jgi:hypothetical protein